MKMVIYMAITKKKKGNKYVYRYDVSYIDVFGKRKRKSSKWYDHKSKAVQAQAEFLALEKKETVRATFGTVCLKWLETSNSNIMELSYRDKKNLAIRYCAPIWDVQMSELNVELIKKYVLENPELVERSTDVKNRVHHTLKSTINYAFMFYGLNKNVMDYIPRFKKTDSERMAEMKVLNPADFYRFELSVENKEFAALFHLLYWSGMRLNECRSLRFKDIVGNKILLRKQFNDRMKKWTSLKTKNSARNINIDSECVALIQSQKDKYKNVPDFSDDWFIFGGFQKLPYTTIERYKNKAIEESKVPYFRIHDLRHSHVANLLDAGVDFYRISKRLGHSSISTTLDRYGHLLDDSESDILEVINARKMRENIKN